jgi:hypothetical protein
LDIFIQAQRHLQKLKNIRQIERTIKWAWDFSNVPEKVEVAIQNYNSMLKQNEHNKIGNAQMEENSALKIFKNVLTSKLLHPSNYYTNEEFERQRKLYEQFKVFSI